MGFKALAWADEVRTGCNGRKSLLLRLAVNADDATGVCWRATTKLSWSLEMGGRSVRRHTADLVAMGLLVISPRFDRKGGQRSNVFRLVFSDEERARILAAAGMTIEDVPARFFKRLKLVEPGEEDEMDEDLFAYAAALEASSTPGASKPPVANLARGDGLTSPGPLDSSGQGGRTHESTHENLSENQNPKSMAGEARKRAERGFDDLWKNWPEDRRPDNHWPALERFAQLAPDDQEQAVRHASSWRKLLRGAKEAHRTNVHDYLTTKAWRQFEGGPPVDGDGYFVITPDRPEWAPWRKFHEARSQNVDSIDKHGIMLRRTRWPYGYDHRLARGAQP